MKTSKIFLPLIALFFFISTVSSFAQSSVSFGFTSNIDRCYWGCPNNYTINFYGQYGDLVNTVTVSTSKDQEVFFDIPTGYYQKIEVSSDAIQWVDPDGWNSRLEINIFNIDSYSPSHQNERLVDSSTMRVEDVDITDTSMPYIFINKYK
ncbi:MAG: hypothetical protein QE277_01995 [Flectobacillus sp.]|nr:hypothetical protein [Flectobacillus sp.]